MGGPCADRSASFSSPFPSCWGRVRRRLRVPRRSRHRCRPLRPRRGRPPHRLCRRVPPAARWTWRWRPRSPRGGRRARGFYDQDTRQMTLVERGSGTFGPLERATLAHEYTHALQDQHFGLADLGLDDLTQGDRALARLGVGGAETLADTLGELTISVWLEPAAGTKDAAAAAAGWGGDRVTMYEGPDGAGVVVWLTAWATPAHAGGVGGPAGA